MVSINSAFLGSVEEIEEDDEEDEEDEMMSK